MDLGADFMAFQELGALMGEVATGARRDAIAEVEARADAGGLVHSAIFSRLLLALDASRAADVGHQVGLLAETQKLWREHEAELVPEFAAMLLTQTMVVLAVLMEAGTAPLARIEAIRANFEQVTRQQGRSLRAAYWLAMVLSHRHGDDTAAHRFYTLAQGEAHDPMTPLPASWPIEFLAASGDDAAAVAHFERLDPAESGIAHARSAALLPMWRLGRTGDAEYLHRHGLDPADVEAGEIGDGEAPHLSYLAVQGRFDEAVALLPAFLHNNDDETNWGKATVAAHVAVLAHHMVAAGRGDEPLPGLSLPGTVPGETAATASGTTPGTSEIPDVRDLLARCRARAEAMARTSDGLNGHDVAKRHLARMWAQLGGPVSP